jgi:hypothetical protein
MTAHQGVFGRAGGGGASGSAPGGAAIIPVTLFGAAGDAQNVIDASIALGSNDVHSPSAPFRPADVGKTMLVPGAGVAGAPLIAPIVTVLSATDVLMGGPAASTAIVSGPAAWGTDNATAIQSAINAQNVISSSGGTGVTIYFPGPSPTDVTKTGKYLVGPLAGAGIEVFNGTHLYGPGAWIISALVPSGGGVGPNVFRHLNVAGASFALALDALEGSIVLAVTGGAFNVGDFLTVQDPGGGLGNEGGTYQVQKVDALNPQHVTLDRGIGFPYFAATASVVALITGPVTEVCIEGFTFTGTCERTVEFSGGFNCPDLLKNVHWTDIVAAPADRPFGYDSFTYACNARDVEVKGPTGGSFEDVDHCALSGFIFEGNQAAGGTGFNIANSYSCVIERFRISGAGAGPTSAGILATPLPAATSNLGTPALTIRDGSITGCLSAGAIDQRGSGAILVERVSIQGNAGAGVVSVVGSNGPVWIYASTIENNAAGAIAVGVGTTGASLVDGCTIGFNGDANGQLCDGILCGGPITIRATTFLPDPNAPANHRTIYISAANSTDFDVRIDDVTIQYTPGGGGPAGVAVVQENGANIRTVITGGRWELNPASVGTEQSGGKMTVKNTTIIGGAFGLDVFAGTLRYRDVIFRGVGAPITIAPGAFCNQGQTVQANGAAVVAVAWPDLQAGEMPKLEVTTLPTAGGFAAIAPLLLALTPGTGFSLQSVAGNNAVYTYDVG